METKLQVPLKQVPLGQRRLSPSLSFSHWSKWILIIITGFFFAYPVVKLVELSLQTEQGIGLQRFSEVFQDSRTWLALEHTLWASLGSTLLAIVIGASLAWVCAYTDIGKKGWIHVLALLPFIIPSYILTLAWTKLAGPAGWLNKWASAIVGEPLVLWNIYGLDGIIIVMGLSHYPLVYMLTLAVLYRIPRDLEWAARSSGASSWQVLCRITLPLALPGIAGGGLLAFISGLDNFGIPAFLGIPAGISVLSTLIYEQVIGFGPSAFSRAAALAVLLGGVALAGTALQWLVVRKAKSDQTQIEDKSVRYPLGRKRVWVECMVWAFLLLTSVIPLLAMFATSLLRAYGLSFQWEHLTLQHFWFVLDGNAATKRSIVNSLVLAACTTLICAVVGTLLAYWRVKQPSKWSKLVEGMVSVPYALPGMVLALAMIFTWMQPLPGWNPGIYGTIGMLLIAYVTRFTILQVRSSSSSILQVTNEVEEAARINGAHAFTRWRRILLPLYLPGILSGAMLVLLTSLTELTISSLLWSSGTETIGVVIYNLEQSGSTVHSTAFSTLVVLAIAVTILFGYLIRQRIVRRLEV